MKICLIYPGISWSGFNVFGKDKGGESNFINHGIASIAAYLTKFGHEIEYVDLRKLSGWNEVKKVLRQSESRIFGISSTTVDFGHAITIGKIIKKIDKKRLVVVGGVHPTVRPDDGLKQKVFDVVVRGEGEIAMLKLIEDVDNKRKIKRLMMGESCQLEEIPHIDRDLFDHRHGEMMNPFVPDMPAPFTTIMSSRGCPYQCTFCQPAERMIFGGKVRLREIKDVVKEIKEISDKYGLKSFLIHDDLFIISKERIVDFVKEYKKSGVKAEFMCQARADLIIRFEKEMKMLKEAGLCGVMIGFESGSDRMLKYMNKQTRVKDNLEAARICHKYGIKIWGNFMLGVPTESYWEMAKTLIMMKRINPDYYSPSLFTPYPETGLYDYCRENKLLIFNKYGDYRRSLKGDKIKGFNYGLIRAMIFASLPLIQKYQLVKSMVIKK